MEVVGGNKVNKYDATDCEACGENDGPCLYHEGFEKGWDLAMAIIKAVAEDPDYAAEHYVART